MNKGDKLTAVSECIMNDDRNPTLTVGKEYQIMDMDSEDFCVLDNEGDQHWFPIIECGLYFDQNL